MDVNRVLEFSSDAGVLLLQSGGETYRVEETVTRICSSFGIEKTGVFATPTAVIVSATVDGKISSVVKRIKKKYWFKQSIWDKCFIKNYITV